MSEFCGKCGAKLKSDDLFCPNCGRKIGFKHEKEVTYPELIKDIIYIRQNNRYRLSKAKLLGVVMFLFIFFNVVFSFAGHMMRSPLMFFINISIIFIAGLFWYGICRAAGYLIRTYAIR